MKLNIVSLFLSLSICLQSTNGCSVEGLADPTILEQDQDCVDRCEDMCWADKYMSTEQEFKDFMSNCLESECGLLPKSGSSIDGTWFQFLQATIVKFDLPSDIPDLILSRLSTRASHRATSYSNQNSFVVNQTVRGNLLVDEFSEVQVMKLLKDFTSGQVLMEPNSKQSTKNSDPVNYAIKWINHRLTEAYEYIMMGEQMHANLYSVNDDSNNIIVRFENTLEDSTSIIIGMPPCAALTYKGLDKYIENIEIPYNVYFKVTGVRNGSELTSSQIKAAMSAKLSQGDHYNLQNSDAFSALYRGVRNIKCTICVSAHIETSVLNFKECRNHRSIRGRSGFKHCNCKSC